MTYPYQFNLHILDRALYLELHRIPHFAPRDSGWRFADNWTRPQ